MELGLVRRKGLFEAYKALKESDEFSPAQAQKKTVTDSLRDFELSGIGLPADEQHRYGEISKRMSSWGPSFPTMSLMPPWAGQSI